MKRLLGKWATGFLLICVCRAEAFIPPVGALAKDAVEGRRFQAITEMVLRHRIAVRAGEVVNIEEQWVGDSSKAFVSFKIVGEAPFTSAQFDKKSYSFPGGMRISSGSGAWVRALLTSSGDELLALLVQEHFVSRDQLNQYKEGFDPKGDPQTWDVKEFYIQQEGVALRRVKSVPAYAFTGGGPEASRSVYFSKEGGGIRRLEAKTGSEAIAWNFEAFSRLQSSGYYPRAMEFERNGQILITSELVTHRPVKEKQVADIRKQRGAGAPTGTNEEALKLLLSFR